MESSPSEKTHLQQELEMLCKQYKRSFNLIAKISYWTAEMYSLGKHLRNYGYYPKWLPLCVYTDHAPGVFGEPFKHELDSTAPVQLYHSPLRVKQWRSVSDKPCYCYYSPFVHYRESNDIRKADDANGTIAFPAHGTPTIVNTSSVGDYIDHLKGLPEQFQPVAICLHSNEVLNGSYEEYVRAGFDVFTAGHYRDDRFAERFYSIIRKFKYSTSNMVGSYTYYCVEMGIPFFVSGELPKYINEGDENLPLGEYDVYKEYDLYRKAHDLFSVVTTSISNEQKSFVTTSLGLHDGLSRLQMARVLYLAVLKCILSGRRMAELFKLYRETGKAVES